MSSEKNLHHFCFWHPSSFELYIVLLSSGTNEIFLPDRLKKKIQLASPQTTRKNVKKDYKIRYFKLMRY